MAIVTPSFVIKGDPYDFSRTTLRPFGPRVVFTVSARISIPRIIAVLASLENLISFDILAPF